uniref:Chemokine interleukin-8-like domain-containing protein n=1 Tax=Equus asinus TaxID=9793 RepID=A0A9L0JG79_EQUAS
GKLIKILTLPKLIYFPFIFDNKYASLFVGQECCLEYLQGTIPARKLMPWYRTSVECPRDVIFQTTHRPRSLLLSCSDPKDTRVKKAVRHMRSFMKSHGPLPRSPDSL